MATQPTTPTASAKTCACGCAAFLTRSKRGVFRKYLPGHAPNFARALDATDLRPESIAAFWANVRLADNAMCWEWVGIKNKKGYGLFRDPVTHRRYYTHRLAAALVFGPLPAGVQINHHCDVTGHGPGCVNPIHGFRGTQSDNLLDAAAKGFMPRKLSASNVLQIRAARQAGVSRIVLAEQFGVARSHITRVVRGRSWRHLLDPEAPPLPMSRPWARKVACLRGHPFDEANTWVDRAGQRWCRTCRRDRLRETYRAKHWPGYQMNLGKEVRGR